MVPVWHQKVRDLQKKLAAGRRKRSMVSVWHQKVGRLQQKLAAGRRVGAGMNIERFFIVANRGKDKEQSFSNEIRAFLQKNGYACYIAYSDEERRNMRMQLRGDSDCLLVLGGDGTVLEGAHLSAGTGTPILGINLGVVGYLAEVDSRCWEQAMRRVMDGEYEIESRMMLDAFVTDADGTPYPGAVGQALNDVVITRNQGLQVVSYNVYIGGQFLTRFSADGMIAATATGSTAYNLSAGGPIVEPRAKLILLTPISPHTLSSRSIVLSADDRITVEMLPPRSGNALCVECDFDGTGRIRLNSGDRVNISSSEETTRLIRLNQMSFLETLHKKITS